MSQIKIGVLGAGHMGKLHLKLLKELPELFEVTSCFDPNPERAKEARESYGAPQAASADDVLHNSDAVIVATTTSSHYELVRKALKLTRHVFVEKPLAATPDEGEKLVKLASEAGVVAQVGHVERFNPAYLAVQHMPLAPMFIEGHRLAPWNPRGTDVSVIYDLMIHDLDLVLHLVKAPIKRISANGVAVVSNTTDIANARIEFHNGAVANLTASRISVTAMRKLRLFQRNAYVNMDFLEKKAEIIRVTEPGEPAPSNSSIHLGTAEFGDTARSFYRDQPETASLNALLEELRSFGQCIRDRKDPPVNFYQSWQALYAAHQIMERIQGTPS